MSTQVKGNMSCRNFIEYEVFSFWGIQTYRSGLQKLFKKDSAEERKYS